jgi:hydrogenase maturation protease
MRETANTLIVGCGNLLRGDDGAGPVLIRRLWQKGLPEGVWCADGGTAGMDVAFQMRGVPHVILVDACRTGVDPGTIYCVPGREVEQLPPLTGINLHAFRWDHALAFARWLLKEEYPTKVTVYLIEAGQTGFTEDISPPVETAIETLCARLLRQLGTSVYAAD